ncbi:Ribosomal L1 domain-containing protein 1 [Tritrichomonas musculus]|uniref:Ribosomal L1 domain-containing protein 1 n=1 Tax=Tritrichomonas musculus TaxID=1915356 RepID=A0ABR2IY84_9EUKA
MSNEDGKAESFTPLTFGAAKHGAIVLQQKYTKCTKRRECPPVFLVIYLKKAPKSQSGPHRISLMHPVRPFPIECSPDHPPIVFVTGEAATWQAAFDKPSKLGSIKLKAISISMLKKKFTTRKSRDEMLSTTPIFFCEHAAASVLPSRLGSQFFSRNKQPIIVTLDINDSDQIFNEIKKATECSELYVKQDKKLMMRVGAFNFTFDHLGENITDAADQAIKIIPKGKKYVESMCLMSSGIETKPIWERNPKIIQLTAEDLVTKSNEDADD